MHARLTSRLRSLSAWCALAFALTACQGGEGDDISATQSGGRAGDPSASTNGGSNAGGGATPPGGASNQNASGDTAGSSSPSGDAAKGGYTFSQTMSVSGGRNDNKIFSRVSLLDDMVKEEVFLNENRTTLRQVTIRREDRTIILDPASKSYSVQNFRLDKSKEIADKTLVYFRDQIPKAKQWKRIAQDDVAGQTCEILTKGGQDGGPKIPRIWAAPAMNGLILRIREQNLLFKTQVERSDIQEGGLTNADFLPPSDYRGPSLD